MAVRDSPGANRAVAAAFGRHAMAEAMPEPLCSWRVPPQLASLVLSHQQMPQISTALG